jgi:hypothetical protein
MTNASAGEPGRAVESLPPMQEQGAVAPSLSLRTPGAALPRAVPRLPGAGWIYVYVAIEITCQLALLLPALAPARILFRSAALGTSLAMFALIPMRQSFPHPAKKFAAFVMVVLTMSALNPASSTALAGIAHWSFYLAVMAPLFWVMRLELPPQTLSRLLIIVWLFSTLSSVFGVLQVYFPGQFQPALSTMIRQEQVMAIRLSSGTWVVRPMGLTDTPGGAGWSGLYATLFGLGMTLAVPFRRARIAGVASMIVGIMCIYLCQIRAMVVMLGICSIVLLGLFAVSGRLSRLVFAASVAGLIAAIGFYMAFSVAGDTVTSRLATLLEDDPSSVYRKNRGHFVATAFKLLLPEYPLGAGLGRWGMMNQYFGNPDDGIWAEVQWSGWVIDGGIFLILAYPAAIIVAIWRAMRVALNPAAGERGLWAAVVSAHGVGSLALTFSYPIFMSTGGLQFWLINAVFVRSLFEPQSSERPS